MGEKRSKQDRRGRDGRILCVTRRDLNIGRCTYVGGSSRERNDPKKMGDPSEEKRDIKSCKQDQSYFSGDWKLRM